MKRSVLLTSLLSSISLLFTLVGCDGSDPAVEVIFDGDALSDATYNLVVLDEGDAVVLLGEIAFSASQDDVLAGEWSLSPWGDHPSFSDLPTSGLLSGFVHADVAIVKLEFGGAGESLGLQVDGFLEDRLVGSISLLPDTSFKGRFEAIATAPERP